MEPPFAKALLEEAKRVFKDAQLAFTGARQNLDKNQDVNQGSVDEVAQAQASEAFLLKWIL